MSDNATTGTFEVECPECWKGDQVVHIAVWVSDDDPPRYLLEWRCERCGGSFYMEDK